MSEQTEGVVILAHETPRTEYNIQTAINSVVKSIRAHQTNHVNICVVTHQSKWLTEIDVDNIVEFKFGDAGYEDGNTLKNMYQIWHCSPYERNLVVGVDTIILQDVNEILNNLRGQRLVFPTQRKTYNNNIVTNPQLVDFHEKLNLKPMCTDFWYFERSQTQDWFDLLGLYSANWNTVADQLGTYAPPNYDNDVLISLVTDVLDMNEEVTDLGILEYTDLGIHGEWTKKFNYWIKPNLIKIENFAIGGLVHLGRKGPFKEIINDY